MAEQKEFLNKFSDYASMLKITSHIAPESIKEKKPVLRYQPDSYISQRNEGFFTRLFNKIRPYFSMPTAKKFA